MGRPKGRDTIYFARCTTCGFLLCLGDEYDGAMREARFSMPIHYEEAHRSRQPGWEIETKRRREVDPHF
ncbi:hypothetical protein [Streptomyces sp. NPDC050145]|uniref:hypothetical protein n=1 Tax=Streptomyces sp. NPDC050145 TaxID=3365602 RepID=UPI0037974123